MIYTDTAIFDLDGTLLNTLTDLFISTNFALKECGFSERTYSEIKNFVGNGVEMLIRRAVPQNTPEDRILECLAIFKIHYSHNSQNNTKPYDGIVELLTDMKKKGFKIGVVSNKFDKAVKNLCQHYFGNLIDIAIGESFDTPKKPNPQGVLKIIKILNSDIKKSVLIGDSEVDVQTAKNAGIYSVGVLWGFRDEKTLIEAGVDELVDSPEKLGYIL